MNINHPLLAFYYKRKSFEHEHELRAAFTRIPCENGDFINFANFKDKDNDVNIESSLDLDETIVEVPANLKTLIEKVYVHPKASDWFKDAIESLVERFGLNKKVERSDLKKNIQYIDSC